MPPDLLSHLDTLTDEQTVESLWNRHLERMAGYGFDRLIYGFTRYLTSTSLGNPQDWILLTNMPAEYMSNFIGEGHYLHAPMLRWSLENDGACSWRWMEDMARADAFTASESRVLEYNRKMQVTAGYTISFRSISARSKGAIALIARPDMSQDAVEQVWARHGEEIVVINKVAHLKLLTLPYAARHLTRRQREVLEWVGDGKTTQDIAQLLGVTPAPVEKHLRLAREALDVQTTAQAVLKAAFYNQMFVMDA